MARPDPGSFRDPTSQVLHADGRVLRVVRGSAREGWDLLQASGLGSYLTERGYLVASAEGDLPQHLQSEGWEKLVEHERIPFVSYPYEWCFSMLRDAALLQLQILLDGLERGITMKDATPYNVQWYGSQPVFIDVGSFKPLEDGEPWLGYRQFCQQFLFPLMLRAYRNVPHQPWLRGTLEGLSATHLRELLGTRALVRRGVLLHVVMQARAEARAAHSARSARDDLKRAGFRKELIEANARRLLRVVAGMGWQPRGSTWSGYVEDYEHVRLDRDAKSAFVERALGKSRRELVWDLGANDGHFSRIAARHAEAVVAMDSDEATVEHLYRALASEQQRTVLPLVVDLADPSPGLGWAGVERSDLLRRGRPDVVLCLAVLHHLAIGRNVPVGRVVEWLAETGAEIVLEFAELDDPMVRRLCLNKKTEEIHGAYGLADLRKLLGDHFDIADEMALPSGRRTLFHARPRR